MTSLKKEMRNADYEIKELRKKEKKSCWYRRKAQESQEKSSSVTDCSSLNSESESDVSLPNPVGVLSPSMQVIHHLLFHLRIHLNQLMD